MLTEVQAQRLSAARKDLWRRLEHIALTAGDVDAAREGVVVALVQFIERKDATVEFEALVRRICQYE